MYVAKKTIIIPHSPILKTKNSASCCPDMEHSLARALENVAFNWSILTRDPLSNSCFRLSGIDVIKKVGIGWRVYQKLFTNCCITLTVKMAGDPNEQRGLQLVAEAQKKIKSSTGFLNNLLGG